ncbi:hypothetical protein KK141_06065 [Dyella sp. LX-66]|uniref:protein YgfX n=1 Tax=unclassified Dyella TaxID=2634549 RepID=UPI001BE06F9F|nr:MULTISPECIES: protein YgfX [unclassified Dyella]MBT2116728.1 hypothetical protein [Dyella sp. LX-1]MBT2139092.1 hypothetical protein [Dyella sp. LX-66]
MTSAPAIGFEYAPSRLAARGCAGMALLAVAAVWLCGLPWWGRLMLSCALAALWVVERRLGRHPAVTAAGWAADGSWALRDAQSADTVAELRSSRLLGGCVWLCLQPSSGRPVNLLLAPDNSDEDLRRRLRMRLAAAMPGR